MDILLPGAVPAVAPQEVVKKARIILDVELFCGIVQTGGYVMDRIHPDVRFLKLQEGPQFLPMLAVDSTI